MIIPISLSMILILLVCGASAIHNVVDFLSSNFLAIIFAIALFIGLLVLWIKSLAYYPKATLATSGLLFVFLMSYIF